MSRVEVQQATKIFGVNRTALAAMSLSIADGELLTIVGPSGSGKTTLLRAIAGLESLSSGRIAFDDHDVTRQSPKDRNVAMVFQQPALYPHLSVLENIAFSLRMRGQPAGEIDGRVRSVAARLKISELLSRRPATLSGGEAQRVALGRALVRRPHCLLMDEPFAALDGPLRIELRGELRRLLRDEPVTTLFVTHDQQEALALGDRVAVLSEGRLQQLGTGEEIYQRPANRFVARFIGSPTMNLLAGSIELHEGRCWFVFGAQAASQVGSPRLALTDWMARRLSKAIGRAVMLGVRPHAIRDTPWPMFNKRHSTIEITVNQCESYGDRQYVSGQTPDEQQLTGLVSSQTTAKSAERSTLYANLAELQFFAGDTHGTNLLHGAV